MKIKTSELTGAALDWAVAAAEQDLTIGIIPKRCVILDEGFETSYWEPSTNWAQGGPIIEREKMYLVPVGSIWRAAHPMDYMKDEYGPNPLVAAMRCFVASKLGAEVDVPGDLL